MARAVVFFQKRSITLEDAPCIAERRATETTAQTIFLMARRSSAFGTLPTDAPVRNSGELACFKASADIPTSLAIRFARLRKSGISFCASTSTWLTIAGQFGMSMLLKTSSISS